MSSWKPELSVPVLDGLCLPPKRSKGRPQGDPILNKTVPKMPPEASKRPTHFGNQTWFNEFSFLAVSLPVGF